MKILLIGDSITKGSHGCSYASLLSKDFPNLSIKNLGINGQTFSVILNRLVNHLKLFDDYDFIAIQGGYNDILLSSFPEKGKIFRMAYNHQLKKGLIPIKPNELNTLLHNRLSQVRELYDGQIILVTLGCANENPNSPTDIKRKSWNQAVRQISISENVLLADAGAVFDRSLQPGKTTDYCLDNFWAVTFSDRLITTFKNGARFLSHRRRLQLSIDGVHLNDKGAAIFSQCMADAIRKHSLQ